MDGGRIHPPSASGPVPGSLLICLASLTWGCRECERADTNVTVVERPVRVEFGERKRWVKPSGRNLPLPYAVFEGVIRIHTPVPIKLTAKCNRPRRELGVDAAGTRVAYRCAPADPWHVVYVGSGGRFIQHCRTFAAGGTGVDWRQVPALEQALLRLFGCRESDPDVLFREARARGDAFVARALVPAMAEGVWTESGRRTVDPWLRLAQTLGPRSRAAVVRALGEALAAKSPSPALVWRAMAMGHDARSLSDGLIAGRLAEWTAPGRTLDEHTARASGLLLREALRRRAPRAGELACSVLRRTGSESPSWARTQLQTHALQVVAGTRTLCPPVAALVEKLCNRKLDCGDWGSRHLCTAEELAKEVDGDLRRSPLAAARDEKLLKTWGDRAALAAAHATRSVPEPMVVRNRRRLYRTVPAAPWCTEAKKKDEPCACFSSVLAVTRFVCNLDWRTKSTRRDRCTIEIDDEKGEIRSRHFCIEKGGTCTLGELSPCCADLRCTDRKCSRIQTAPPTGDGTGKAGPPPGPPPAGAGAGRR